MPQVKPSVKLLEYTPNPERTIALAAKLCYSDVYHSCIVAICFWNFSTAWLPNASIASGIT